MEYIISSGVTSDGIILENNSMTILNGGTATNTTVNSRGNMSVSSGGTAENTTVNINGFLYIYSGGVAIRTTVNNNGGALAGGLFVMGGGTADSTTVSSGGTMYLSSGGVANNTVVNVGGKLYVSKGGIANEIIENGGYVYIADGTNAVFASNTITGLLLSNSATVHSGTTANSTTINARGSMYIYGGGIASNATINFGGWINISSGGIVNNVTVNKGGRLNVSKGGVASEIIENGGYVYVADGANAVFASNTISGLVLSNASATVHSGTTANSTTVTSGGILHVYSGGTATDIVWTPCEGHVYVSEGGSATFVSQYSGVYYGSDNQLLSKADIMDGTTVNSSGEINVMTGGVANNTTINSRGSMFVSSGGTAESTMVNSSGRLYVFSGGTANNTVVNAGGYLYISSGGTATEIIENGGYVDVADGANPLFAPNEISGLVISNASATVHSGTTANSTTVKINGSFYVYHGGVANSTTVDSRGYLYVSSAVVNSTKVNSSGYLAVFSGGTANNTVVNAGGCLYVSSSGIANDTTVSPGGYLYVSSGGMANDTTVSSGGYLYVSSGGTANDTTVSSGGYLYISSGVTANSTMVNSWGSMYILSGGTANNTVVNAGGRLFVSSGGTANEITENGGFVDVADGANAVFASKTISGLVLSNASATVHSGTTANSTTVNLNGYFYVFDGGIANSTTVDSRGYLRVSSGGMANYVNVNSGGYLSVVTGGVAESISVYSGGRLDISAAGKITGKMLFESGAQVFASAGSIVNFDLTQTSAGTTPLLNDFSALIGAPSYTITVDGTQEAGLYRLADGVSIFYNVIAVVNSEGIQLGTLSCGQTSTLGDVDYTLNIANGSLTVTINPTDKTPPEKPETTADITTPTNGDVLVTATFSEDSVLKEYSLDGENWGVYAGGVLFSSNRTAYFRSIDAVGNISEIAEYEVTNIDRTAPNKPVVSADVTTPTNRSVTVSAKFDEDSSTKEYSLDGEKWLIYTNAILCVKNETVSFRGIDEAGNMSEVASLEVCNIDTEAPSDPTGLQAVVSEQTVAMVWNASADEDSGVKEYIVTYSLNGQDFTVRTINTNYVLNNADFGDYSWTVQAVDFAGNESDVVSGDAFTVSGFKPYTVEYSADNFEHVITFAVTTPTLNAFRMPGGTYQMRVRQEGSSEWLTGDSIVAPAFEETPQLVKSDSDGNADVFFANPVGTWESGYVAQHVGSINDWGGTNEYASVYGKNKLADIIEGSSDANILLMTDDDNGDTLFVDDIYTASPGNMAEQQARIARIDEIRAGAGNDIVDMTSQQFEYIGDGLTIRGGAGNDTIWANKGDNWLFGDAGNDRIVGASGNDVIAGGIGNDRMHGGGGSDVFAFCENWGADNVEQLGTGTVTLWFASGSIENWDEAALTYSDGENSVKVSGVTADKVTLKFGDDGSDQFASLTSMGSFFDATTERIFEESGKGMLASL